MVDSYEFQGKIKKLSLKRHTIKKYKEKICKKCLNKSVHREGMIDKNKFILESVNKSNSFKSEQKINELLKRNIEDDAKSLLTANILKSKTEDQKSLKNSLSVNPDPKKKRLSYIGSDNISLDLFKKSKSKESKSVSRKKKSKSLSKQKTLSYIKLSKKSKKNSIRSLFQTSFSMKKIKNKQKSGFFKKAVLKNQVSLISNSSLNVSQISVRNFNPKNRKNQTSIFSRNKSKQ